MDSLAEPLRIHQPDPPASLTKPVSLLTQRGWRSGVPAIITQETEQASRKVCAGLLCPACGRGRMHYHPLTDGVHCRVFAVCGRASCAHEMEV